MGVVVGVIVTVVMPLPCDDGVAVTVVVLISPPPPPPPASPENMGLVLLETLLVVPDAEELDVLDVLLNMVDEEEEDGEEGDTVVVTAEVRVPGWPD